MGWPERFLRKESRGSSLRTLLPTIDLVVWKDPGFGRIPRVLP